MSQVTSVEQVNNYIKHRPRGMIFTNEQVANRTNLPHGHVSKALTRLSGKNTVRRIAKGFWVRPKESRFGQILAPANEIVRAMERHKNMLAVPAGAAAVNALTLSTQMAMRPRYVTTRRIDSITIGKQVVEFHYSRSLAQAVEKLRGLNNTEKHHAATIRVALQYLGREKAAKSRSIISQAVQQLSPTAREKLRATLNGPLAWARDYVAV